MTTPTPQDLTFAADWICEERSHPDGPRLLAVSLWLRHIAQGEEELAKLATHKVDTPRRVGRISSATSLTKPAKGA